MNDNLKVNIYSDITPHRYAKEFHYWASKKEIKYIVLILPRQNGKTTTLIAEAINKLLSSKIEACWIAPTESQAIRSYEKLYIALDKFIFSSKRTHGQFEIILTNGSKISFKPSSSESIRGLTLQLLILDEFQDINPDDLSGKILPCASANGGRLQVYVSGTPKGHANHLYEWSRRESLGYKGYKTVHCEINDELSNYPNPAIDLDFVISQRQTISPRQFDAEYRGKFASGFGFFSNINSQATITELYEGIEGIKYYGSADIGIVNDNSQIVIYNEFKEMVHCSTLSKTNSVAIRNRIKELQKAFNVVFWVIEKNNQGLPIIQELIMDKDEPMFNIEMFQTSYNSKIEILNKMENMLARKQVWLLNRKDVKDEFGDFECKTLPSGKMKMAAGSGTDDIVIAACLGLYCVEAHDKKGEYHWAVI